MQNQNKLHYSPDAEDGAVREHDQSKRVELSVVHTAEIRLWEALKKGEEEALGEIYNLYVEDLFAYGIQLTQDRSAVMDFIHDLFVDLFKYRKNISIKGNAKHYLFLSLKRNIYRKYRKHTESLSGDHDMLLANNLKLATRSPEEMIVRDEGRSEQVEKLSTALNGLTKKQKKSIQLKYIQERTYEEISEIMGVSIETVRTTIYRALKSLRE